MEALPLAMAMGPASQAGAAFSSPLDDPNTISWWDMRDSGSMVVGGYSLNGTSQYWNNTSNAPSGIDGSSTWAVMWLEPRGALETVLTFYNGSSHEKGIYLPADGTSIACYSIGGGFGSAGAPLEASRVWQMGIAVWEHAASRTMYTTAGTAGTDTTSITQTALTSVSLGRHFTGVQYRTGRQGPVWIYSGVIPDATQRAAIFRSGDPTKVNVPGATLIASWPLWTDSNDTLGITNLTANGSPPQLNHIIYLRDKGASGLHYKQIDSSVTSLPPTWGTGKVNFGGSHSVGSYEYLENRSFGNLTAPFQVYAVAEVKDNTRSHGVFSIVNRNSADDLWTMQFRGDRNGDPVYWTVVDGSSGNAASSTSFSTNTPTLLWALEESAISRLVEKNSAGLGSDTTNLSPDGINQSNFGVTGATPGTEAETDWFSGSIYQVWLVKTSSLINKSKHEGYAHNKHGVP